MKMHMYTGSTRNDLLHGDVTSSLPQLSDETIAAYLHNVLDGSVQPLLSIFPNPLTNTNDNDDNNNNSTTPSFPHSLLYPTIASLYPSTDPRYAASKPISDTILVSQRHVIPPYLPSSETYEHARSESVVTASKAWAEHVAIRKLLKSLWKVGGDAAAADDDHHNDNEDKDAHTTITTIPPRCGLIDLKNDSDPDTKAFKDTIRAMAVLLQNNIGLTLFGFDVVQNYYTKALTVIDVNYFPAYTAVQNFPTRVALEVLKKHQRVVGGGVSPQ